MTPSWSVLEREFMKLDMHPDGNFFSCAVRVSICLHAAGAFNKFAYKKAGHAVTQHGWARAAEQLYQWLRRHELGAAQRIPLTYKVTGKGASAVGDFPSQNGIIYLRDCFTREGESDAGRTGDHFDLYDASKGMLSAVRWPHEFPNGQWGLLVTCRDRIVRYWPAA